MRRPTGRAAKLLSWLPVALWVGLIFGLSSIPDLGPPDVGLPWADKICHFGEYGILGSLFTWARARRPAARRAAWGFVLGLVVGTLDELYQRSTPGRESSALDAIADVCGATAGALVAPAWVEPAARRIWTAVRRRSNGSKR